MSSKNSPARRAVIFGLAATHLTAEERDFLAETRPWGYIVFARNIESRAQLTALIDDVRALDGRAHLPVLIDQEGGRVARLRPPLALAHPPSAFYGRIYQDDRQRACAAARLGAEIIARELAACGVTLNAMPCLDMSFRVPCDIIGDRAYGDNVEQVVALGVSATRGLAAGGVIAIAKHLPGHGRALVDSHHELPIIDTPYEVLAASDFAVFQHYFTALADEPVLGMSGHLQFTALDAARVSTCSPRIIALIRDEIGFDGVLMSDDISMAALGGDMAARAQAACAAGCDLVLHCNGDMVEMRAVASVVSQVDGKIAQRLAAVEAAIAARAAIPALAVAALRAEWDALIAPWQEGAHG